MSSQPKTSDSPKAPSPSEEHLEGMEHLEEMTEETNKKMDSARRDVERAKETLHDQILPDSPAAALEPDEEERDEEDEKDHDARGAWPNWS
jgi:hypothetical protein